jgi:hypothetical protein
MMVMVMAFSFHFPNFTVTVAKSLRVSTVEDSCAQESQVRSEQVSFLNELSCKEKGERGNKDQPMHNFSSAGLFKFNSSEC